MYRDRRPEPRPSSSTLIWVIVAVIVTLLLAGAAWWWWQGGQVRIPSPSSPVLTGTAPGAAGRPGAASSGADGQAPGAGASYTGTSGIQFPIEQAQSGAAVEPEAEPAPPLPALDDSDADLLAELSARQNRAAWDTLLAPQALIRRFVATVDNLPREQVAPQVLPVRPVGGTLRVTPTPQGGLVISADNGARYAAYVKALDAVDVRAAVALYVRWYPLFQQAYLDLGYPKGYFNDRLVEVIDHLLATPTINEPLAVVQPRVMYQYADASLEERSAGQKILLRMGPENAARVKAKLLAVRQAVVGQRRALVPAPGRR